MVDSSIIESFLHGNNPMKWVVGVEANYSSSYVDLIINDPETGKRIEKHPFKPFLWFKEDVVKILYGGNRVKAMQQAKKWEIKSQRLKTANTDGFTPKRLQNGFKYIATCNKSYNDLIRYFKEGGVDIFSKEHSKLFFSFSPIEQFMIQTGIRMFKGIDDYNDLHRFQFDLETEGLSGKRDAIFQIGMKDNRGFEYVLETKGSTPQERRDCERQNIRKFFKTIDYLKPDTIVGYNSESFDWQFLIDRCERLSMPISDVSICLDGKSSLTRKPAMLKLGNSMERYNQTYMYGYNIVDIAHSVRRAQAINSDIKKWSLKWITKFSEVEKKNRVYVPGDKIHDIWADKINSYAFNDENGDWYKVSERMPLRDNYVVVQGDYIIQRYLIDDLWETEQIDRIFNQAAFLIAKLLPTTYSRSCTMGTASQWKLIMAAWSYENGLAIPETEPKRDFTGGLSRMFSVGFIKNVVKLDYAALYPKTELTHDIFPDLDISNVMVGLLTYVVDTRDKFKFLTGKEKKLAEKISNEIDANINIYTKEKLDELRIELKKHKDLTSLYDKKQLPLKILANSWFGAYGAPYIFNWGDSDSAEETTCRGRQYLRQMVKHFVHKYGFKPHIGDSVTHDTPIYLKNKENGNIVILPICDLFNENSEYLDNEKLRDFEEKPYLVLTVNGWKELRYIYRHNSNKQIKRITTRDRLINVTEDHSLFQNKTKIKPSELKRGDLIDIYNIVPNINKNITITEDEAFLYGFFLGDGSATCSFRDKIYISKKTNETKIYKQSRSDWKISNSRIELLENLQRILKERFNLNGLIKNHLESSGVYNLVVHKAPFAKIFCYEFYTSYREKKVPEFILNADLKAKRAFINGTFASDGYGDSIEDCVSIGMKSQIAMAGISILLKELNIDYKISTRKNKLNFISFDLKNRIRKIDNFTEKTRKKPNEVWKNELIFNNDKNSYVYDISTDDGTFIGGIGGICCSNTDGVNMSFPDNINDVKYIAKGSHWKTTEYANQELTGLEAVLAEFNETFMHGRMGLDIDDIYDSTINFSRKNYANKLIGKKGKKNKIKFVGNSIKSKKMPVYIEEFLDKAIRMLLDGMGYEFIEYYYQYVDLIYNFNIPVVKIASKSTVRKTVSEYKKDTLKKNKTGNPMPRQAHMELVVKNNLDVNLGDTIYYVNTGDSKNDGDLKSIKKDNGSVEIMLNCKIIDPSVIESNLEMIKEIETIKKIILNETDEIKIKEYEMEIIGLEGKLLKDEYNVPKYLEAFNNKLKPLLVCFHPNIRKDILLTTKKDKVTKLEKLTDRPVFTESQCELVSGMPNNPEDQDTYEELMTMEDKEIRFWTSVDKIPNNMTEEEFEKVKIDYFERKRVEREDGIKHEIELLQNIFQMVELEELIKIKNGELIPEQILRFAELNDENGDFVSIKWQVIVGNFADILKWENEITERDAWYKQIENQPIKKKKGEKKDKRTNYEKWLDYKKELNVGLFKQDNEIILKNDTNLAESIKKISNILKSEDHLIPINNEIEIDDEIEEEEDEEIFDDFNAELQQFEFDVETSNSNNQTIPIIKEEDEWNF